ncbi:MAG TPA: hypothetical protein PKE16_06380, partial [Hyphomicrobium sp.]|nr:hypothetical protein [Hyphomicrobium sp.]
MTADSGAHDDDKKLIVDNNQLQRSAGPHLARMLRYILFPRASSRLLAYALCLVVLIPSLT